MILYRMANAKTLAVGEIVSGFETILRRQEYSTYRFHYIHGSSNIEAHDIFFLRKSMLDLGADEHSKTDVY